jgi:hypothetical protein
VASKKTWVWVLVTCAVLAIIAMFAVAGLGLYFVTSHVSTGRTSDRDALRTFDETRARFKDQRPLFEIGSDDRPRFTRRLTDLPTSPAKPQNLWILAWDPDEERLSKISLPFWMLRIGKQKIEISERHHGFALEDLDLDVNELERVGPLLVFDFRTSSGERVLVWTQ